MGTGFTGFDINTGGHAFPTIPFLGSSAAAAEYCTAVDSYFEKYSDFLKDPILIAGQSLLESAAQTALLLYQKGKYDDIAEDQRDTLCDAVDRFCDSTQELLDSNIYEDAYPDVPEAAEYKPLIDCDEYEAAMQCIIDTASQGEEAAATLDQAQLRNAIARVVQLDPKYTKNIELYECQVVSLLEGRVEVDTIVEVLSDVAEQSFVNGKVGCARNSRRNALNRIRLRTQALGRQNKRQLLNTLNRNVFPIGRQLNLREMIVTPEQKISLALTQAQLMQQSLQNLYNQQSLKPPARLAELQMRLQKLLARLGHEAGKANLINQYVPNYAGILQPQISTLSSFAVGAGRNIFGSNVSEGAGNQGIFDRGTVGFPTITGI